MTQPFKVFASDAVLIGVCFGAYQTELEKNPEIDLGSLIDVYLKPFMPSNPREHLMVVSNPMEELPAGLHWSYVGTSLKEEERTRIRESLAINLEKLLARSSGDIGNLVNDLRDDPGWRTLFSILAALAPQSAACITPAFGLPIGNSPTNPKSFYFVAGQTIYRSSPRESYLPDLLLDYLDAVATDSTRRASGN